MHIEVVDQISLVDKSAWNALLKDNNPFMRYEFLAGLEQCDCVCPQLGWQVQHIAAYSDASKQQLVGVMPCYIKDHSYGEYIFDWAWADAYHRHGLEYYPKLCNAVPFTPATGPRWLCAEADEAKISEALLQESLKLAQNQKLSSVHSLFLTQEHAELAQQNGFSVRSSTQFHWQNRDYQSFDSFLQAMSSKKRKNIKRERRRVQEQGVEYRWLSGDDLDQDAVEQMTRFYHRTVQYYGAQAYLNRRFFDYLASEFAEQTLFLFAYFEGRAIAGGLYFKSDHTLYGRYWGALANFHSVHFETCYYQPIQWCIENGYKRFEAGAQGEHKLARGLEPCTTYSAHWIAHAQFRNAIDDFLVQESDHIQHYQETMQRHTPFKREL